MPLHPFSVLNRSNEKGPRHLGAGRRLSFATRYIASGNARRSGSVPVLSIFELQAQIVMATRYKRVTVTVNSGAFTVASRLALRRFR